MSKNIANNNSTFQLNDEYESKKERNNERKGIIIGILSQFIKALNLIQLKTFNSFYPNDFSINSLIFWRSLSVWVLGYILCLKKGIRIKPLNELGKKYLFILRNLLDFISTFLLIKILSYFRSSTSQVVSECNPILVIFLSILIFHKKFYFRYIINAFVCIFSFSLILINENNPDISNIKLNNNKVSGLFFIICYLLVNGFLRLAQRKLLTEIMPLNEAIYYLGMFNTLPAFLICIIQKNFGFGNIRYILYAITNGIFLFYLSTYLLNKAYEYIPIKKYIIIFRMSTMLVFVFGFVFLGEIIYTTDMIAAGLIILFQLYDFYYPPER